MSSNDRLPRPGAGSPVALASLGAPLPTTATGNTGSSTGRLPGRRIVLGITGSISAYKAVLLFRRLQAEGAVVDVILTASASQFVGAATFRGLGARVHTSMFSESGPGELHVELGQQADLLLIVPATADTLARLRQGRADDLLSATALCANCPVAVAPAMHPAMWSHPAVQDNVRALTSWGVHVFGPARGEVASGDVGLGRLSEPEDILDSVLSLLSRRPARAGFTRRHIVVTAGPTSEPLDPVRSLTNVSSGKMGYAIARVAAAWGARVTLITGPVGLETPPGVERVPVGTALEMQAALQVAVGDDLTQADAVVMAAAVADYRPAHASDQKVKRTPDGLTLELVPNPDLIATLGGERRGSTPTLIAFALETASDDQLLTLARHKLVKKRVDLIVANRAEDSLGRDDNRALLVSVRDCRRVERTSKDELAAHILEWLEQHWAQLDAAPSEVTL